MPFFDWLLRGADRFVRAAEDAVAALGDAIEQAGEEIAEAELGLSGRERRKRRRATRRKGREQHRRIFQARLEERRRRQREAKGKPPRKPKRVPPPPPSGVPPPRLEPGQEYVLLRLDSSGIHRSNPVMVRPDYQRVAYSTEEPGHTSADSLIEAGVPIYAMAYAYWLDERALPYVLYVGPS